VALGVAWEVAGAAVVGDVAVLGNKLFNNYLRRNYVKGIGLVDHYVLHIYIFFWKIVI
jgi:hypothetical protein